METGVHGMATKLSLPLPSPCSTPSPDFSFTISFDSPSSTASGTVIEPSARRICYKSPPPSEVGMAPADDLFFHGHLLPLQLFRHPPLHTSTGGSLHSADDTTRSCPRQDSGSTVTAGDTNSVGGSSFSTSTNTSSSGESKERAKGMAASLLRGLGKWWRGSEEAKERDTDGKRSKKTVFDVMGRALKRYRSAVEPLFSFKSGRDRRGDLRRRPYSFSANTNSTVVRREEYGHRRRGKFSAPASMKTSPTNSGFLLATPANPGPSDASTMEELQSAVQAAIAHCKNSIAVKEGGRV